MLQIRQLSCMAGYRPLFSGLDADLSGGQWLMLTGPNGTGKTTLLRALAGLVRPVAGELHWGDAPVRATAQSWRRKLHYLAHSSALKDSLNARENLGLQLALDLGTRPPDKQLIELLRRVGLTGRDTLPVARLSAGQRRRVQLARLAASNRQLWLLDEPANALDRDGDLLLGELLDQHLACGGCAVIATHQPIQCNTAAHQLDMGTTGSANPDRQQ